MLDMYVRFYYIRGYDMLFVIDEAFFSSERTSITSQSVMLIWIIFFMF